MALFARSSTESIDASQIRDFVSETIISQYFQVATTTVLVFDTLVTFDKEVKYFWKMPRRPVDFVFFVNRYIGILGSIADIAGELFDSSHLVLVLRQMRNIQVNTFSASHALCNFAQWMQVIANWISIISIDYILMIRVLALYSRDETLSSCLKILLTLEAASLLGLAIYLNRLVHVAVGEFANMAFCGFDGNPPWRLGMVDWLIPMAYGVLLMVLALYKAAEYWRVSAGFKGFTLVRVLIEDQIIYFVIAIACSIFAILEFKLGLSNVYLSSILYSLGNPSYLCLLGSRMLFNLKEAGERGQNEGTNYRTPSETISGMNFAEPVNIQRESETELSGSGREV